MLNLGMPTMIETTSIEAGAKTCRELGLQFLELNINFPQYLLPELDPEVL